MPIRYYRADFSRQLTINGFHNLSYLFSSIHSLMLIKNQFKFELEWNWRVQYHIKCCWKWWSCQKQCKPIETDCFNDFFESWNLSFVSCWMNLILHDFCLWCADAKYGKTLTLIYNIAMNESLKLNDGNDLFDERKKQCIYWNGRTKATKVILVLRLKCNTV